jgi:hypothetical protein
MVDPTQFGEQHDARWKQGRSFEETCRIAAAYAQHLASFEVRQVLRERKRSAEWFATRLGQNPVQVRRKLDGDYPALPEERVPPRGGSEGDPQRAVGSLGSG